MFTKGKFSRSEESSEIDISKLFHLRHEIFCKLYELSKLVIYAFTFRDNLARIAFSMVKYSVVCTEFPMGSKFHFLNGKSIFSNLSLLINT